MLIIKGSKKVDKDKMTRKQVSIWAGRARKQSALALLAGVIFTFSVRAQANPNVQYGYPSKKGTLLTRQGYVLLYDDSKKIPLWVSYHFTSADLKNPVKRIDSFKADPDLKPGKRAELVDYKGGKYDRGHMAPARDMARSRAVMDVSFYLSNMCPQIKSLNRGLWEDLEEEGRKLAEKFGEVWIIVGPITRDINGDGKGDCLETIGPDKVCAPTDFFKIIVLKAGSPKKLYAVAFIMENRKPELGKSLETYSVKIDDIEKLTGLDFLDQLPDEQEKKLESKVGKLSEISP